MPSSCCAPGCTRRLVTGTNEVKMFRLPMSDPERLNKWIVKIGRLPAPGNKSVRPDGLWQPIDHNRVCNMHFVTGKPSTDPLHVDYIPTVFEHTPLPKKTPNVLQSKLDRSNRVKGREENKSKSAAALALLQLSDCENVSQVQV